MAETVPVDRPPAARATASQPRFRVAATVSASALAQHLDCSRSYIGKLEAEGVSGKVTASRSTRAALPTCDTCGGSGSNRRARRLTRSTPRQRPKCYRSGSRRRSATWCAGPMPMP